MNWKDEHLQHLSSRLKHDSPYIVGAIFVLFILWEVGAIDSVAWSNDVVKIQTQLDSVKRGQISNKTMLRKNQTTLEELHRSAATTAAQIEARGEQLKSIDRKLDLLLQQQITRPRRN